MKQKMIKLNISKTGALYCLHQRVEQIQRLLYQKEIISSTDIRFNLEIVKYNVWKKYTEGILELIFFNAKIKEKYSATAPTNDEIKLINSKSTDKEFDSHYLDISSKEGYICSLLDLIKDCDDSDIISTSENIIKSEIAKSLREEREELKPKKIFVIYGAYDNHSTDLLHLKDFLMNRLYLEPVILNTNTNINLSASTLIEKFERSAKSCRFAIALLTADDQVTNNDTNYFQPRPNVIFELGWFARHLTRNKMLLLIKRDSKLHLFSNFEGILKVNYLNIRESFEVIRKTLEDTYNN